MKLFGFAAALIVLVQLSFSLIICYACVCVGVSLVRVANGCDKPQVQIEQYVHGGLFCPAKR